MSYAGSHHKKKQPVDEERDEFEDLLADEGIKSSAGPSYKYVIPGTQQAAPKGGKCYPIFVGGSSLANGQTSSSMAPVSCDKLRCGDCAKRIVRFAEDCRWNTSIVDYLFVRNFNTSPDKLRDGLETAPGFAAYACQCQFISVDGTKKIEEYSHLKWHCAGH